ncbi:MAG: universal stress protein [Spirochaetales bacterium]|nr:universal stress protein [Spirochaetales bacterium]
MIKKILIVIDDLAPDIYVVDRGIKLAEQLGARIGLIDVARLSLGYIEAGIYPEDLEEINRQRAEKTVEKIKEQYPDMEFVDFEPVGDPVEEIKDIVAEWRPDMLVVGHHKHAFLQRMSENIKERRLVNRINIPVLVIPCD